MLLLLGFEMLQERHHHTYFIVRRYRLDGKVVLTDYTHSPELCWGQGYPFLGDPDALFELRVYYGHAFGCGRELSIGDPAKKPGCSKQ
jgi:hypothetical protein